MRALVVQLPDSQTLAYRLSAVLNSSGPSGDRVIILARESNPHRSTYPSEVVNCRLANGSEVRLLCKYATRRRHDPYGHRRGVTYEAEVYHHVLKSLPVCAPTFYGLHKDAITDVAWFILEYIDKAVRVQDSRDPALMYAAARWLGEFHQANESRLSIAALPFLHIYDAAYYLGWAARTSQFAGSLHQLFPWLATLCRRFQDVVGCLLDPPAIIIHGEYYPNNILFLHGRIYPVDWESTAVATGEIDLASLVERWPATTVRSCIKAYISARWPHGAPAGFEQKLDVARLYWRFRWLGERPDWTNERKSQWRFHELRSIGQRLGLI
jgi:hypothetical protein